MMNSNIYTDEFFDDLSYAELNSFLKYNHNKLIGSCVFSATDSFISKTIQTLTRNPHNEFVPLHVDDDFIPSHVGQIIEVDGQLLVFHMKFPRAYVEPLIMYLLETYDKYELVLRHVDMDVEKFSRNVYAHNKEFYPIGSALLSLIGFKQTPFKMHCSELYVRECKRAGGTIFLNPECTPVQLYDYIIDK